MTEVWFYSMNSFLFQWWIWIIYCSNHKLNTCLQNQWNKSLWTEWCNYMRPTLTAERSPGVLGYIRVPSITPGLTEFTLTPNGPSSESSPANIYTTKKTQLISGLKLVIQLFVFIDWEPYMTRVDTRQTKTNLPSRKRSGIKNYQSSLGSKFATTTDRRTHV